ncbi:MAG: hypothetical protein ACLPUO_08025, partial [Streptosporangiaceae bacterium]
MSVGASNDRPGSGRCRARPPRQRGWRRIRRPASARNSRAGKISRDRPGCLNRLGRGLAENAGHIGGLFAVDHRAGVLVALTMAFRRWRHLLVFLGSVLFLELAGTSIYFGLSRPRPYGVPIIGSWGGY